MECHVRYKTCLSVRLSTFDIDDTDDREETTLGIVNIFLKPNYMIVTQRFRLLNLK
jgi:hypothetical protein